jgi:integrase
MGLYKRGRSGMWWMSFMYRGEQVKRSTETTNRKLAQRIFDKIKGEIAEEKWFEKLPGEDKTFKEMMEKYLSEHSARNKTQKSHIRDKGISKHLLPSFGDLTIAEITPKLIAGYKTKRREEGVSPRTVNYELTLMGHAFNLAIKEWEWCKENPVRRISKEKVNNIIERWMTYEEEQKLLDASIEWLRPILIFGIETGLRQSELLNLRWSNVDLFRRTLTVLEQKNKGRDTLPLSEKAMEILKARVKVRSINSDLVFFNGNGNRIDARDLLRAFYSATRKAKIENLRWHDATRHTFATRLVQNGVDIYTVQKLGRWKNISMVMRYAHHHPESLRAGIEVLDKARKKVRTNLEQSDGKGEVSTV